MSEPEQPETKTKRKHSKTTSPVVTRPFSECVLELNETERAFVREALKDGDYWRSARVVKHRWPYDLLARANVRSALLSAAPFTTSDLTKRLVAPFVKQQLIHSALSGDLPASKVLLTLPVDEPVVKPLSYSRTVTSTEGATNTPSESTDSSIDGE
jgi:hypothetical protein